MIADVRGTSGSTGAWNPASQQDGRDGAHLVDWAAKPPGSNGKVGMFGDSFPALSALRTAESVSPGSLLRAIVPMAMPNDIFTEVLGHDGMMSPILLTAISVLVPYPSLIGPFMTAVVSPQLFIQALADHLQAVVSTDSTIKLPIPTDLPRLLGSSRQLHRDAARPSSLVVPPAPASAFGG